MTEQERATEQHKNFKWFVENHRQLYLLHGKGHVVIVNQGFKAIFPTIREAMDYVEKQGFEAYNIQYNDGTPDGYTVHVYSPFFHV